MSWIDGIVFKFVAIMKRKSALTLTQSQLLRIAPSYKDKIKTSSFLKLNRRNHGNQNNKFIL